MLRRKKGRQSNLNGIKQKNYEGAIEDEKSHDGSGTEVTIINVKNQNCAILSEAASRIDLQRFMP
jgi:hypothetical protein